ncbi:MAG: AsmA family protein [Alphaproteobacteria bacterium]|nr:AsmA family protein [Alphaproteobacteria bacterium]
MFVFFGSLLVLVLFAALIGPYFVDWSSYRENFEKQASHILGQKVRVLGSADARLVPFPSVSFDNVVVGEGEDGEPMMTVDRFSMDAELAPFLSGEIRIFDMRIENPKAIVRLSAEGELDWALRSEKTLPGSALVLENIGVVNGEVIVLDEQNARQHVLDGLNMHMSAKSISGPWQVEGAARLNGLRSAFSLIAGTPTADGGMRLRAKLLPVSQPIEIELEGDARIEALKPRYSGNFTVQALDTSKIQSEGAVKGKRGRRPLYAKARGVFQLDNERLRIEDYRLETGTPKDPYVISGEATFDTGRNPEFLLIADGQQLNFDRVGDGADSPEATARSFEQRLAALRALLAWAPVPQMPGRVSAALPAIVAGDTTIRDIFIDAHPDGGAWRIERLEAKLPGRTQFLAEGRLGVGAEFGFSGEMVVASNQPSGFASWLTTDVDPSIRRLDAAGLSARVDLSAQLQRFDQMEIAIGTASLKGRLERVVPMQGRPSLNILLDGEDVDLDAIRAFAGLIVGDGQGNRLAGHDISARLSAARFDAFGVSAKGADLSLRLKGGTLDIDRFTVTDIAGASISSVGRVQNVFQGPEGDLDISITAERTERILTLLSEWAGDQPIVDHLRDNAALFTDTTLDLQSRFSNRQGDRAVMSATARGETGGSKFNLTIEREDALAPLDTGQVTITADIRNDAPRALLGQMGVELLPVDLPGPANLGLRVEGMPAQDLAFSLDYKAPDSAVTATGTARQGENKSLESTFDVVLSSQDLSTYLATTGLTLAGPEMALPAEIKSTVVLAPETIALSSIDGTAGDTAFSGDLTLARGKDEIEAQGAISVSTMDLAWMAEMMMGSGTVLSGGSSWNDQEFLPPLQSATSLDFDIQANEVHLGFGEDAALWSGKLVLQDNELQWRDVQASWAGGDLSGGLRLANRDGSGFLSGQIKIEGATLAPLVWQQDGFPTAKGSMDLAASFEGAGKSLRGLVASMTGSGVLETHALELSGLENESLPDILAAADTDGFEIGNESVMALAESAVTNGSFFADEISVPFTIAAGTIRLPNIVLSDEGASIRGEARLDLPERAINARFDLEFDPETEALTGAAPAINLAFLGPVAEPDRMIDASELSNFLSLRAYERERRRVETLQAVVLESQRLRREVALSRERAQKRQTALERFEKEEAERQAIEKANLEKQQKEQLAAQEAARLAAEKEALRRAEEEKKRKLVEEQERAAKKAADRFSRESGKPLSDEEFILQLEEAIKRAGDRKQGTGSATGPSGAGGVQTQNLPALNFDTLDADGSVATQ